jgi:hypothetical protein
MLQYSALSHKTTYPDMEVVDSLADLQEFMGKASNPTLAASGGNFHSIVSIFHSNLWSPSWVIILVLMVISRTKIKIAFPTKVFK